VDKTLDSNSSLIPGNLISKAKLKIPRHQGDIGENPSLCATVLKLIDTRMFAVGFTDGSISFYNLVNYELVASTWRHKASITSLEMLYARDGSKLLISGSSEEESAIIIWDVRKPIRPIKRLKGHEHAISCIRELGDNSTIATASFDGKIVLWDVCNNFQCVQILDDNKGPVTC
jgi:WD40 repeat protein